MRILVAGAGGAVGRALLPALLSRGHVVAGLVKRPESAAAIARSGATPFVADALDARQVRECLESFRPEAVTHQLTAIPRTTDLRHFERLFEPTNALRTTGLDNLLAAARHVGVRRFVAQSFCGWPFAREGGPVKTEEDPLDPEPARAMRTTLDALRHVESSMSAAADLRGAALRYGAFYGPGTSIAADGDLVRQVRRRMAPVVGAGGGIWSFVHIEDVASATAAALESDAAGIFNVADDEPAPVAAWLPELARAIGAKAPRSVPAWLGRILLPEHVFLMMTANRGGSNAKFKRTFGWQPRFATWRDGFRRGL